MSQPLKTVRMQWKGPAHKLPRTFDLPIPYLARSERVGAVETDAQGFCDMPEEYVEAAKEYVGMVVVEGGDIPTKATAKTHVPAVPSTVFDSKQACLNDIAERGIPATPKHCGFGRWKAIPAVAQAAS